MASTVQPRFDYRKYSPEPIQAMLALEKYIASCGLDHKFIHLLKLRASQINGCAFCIDMHSIDARAEGETEQRLYALNAWRETNFFTDRERAGLAWIEVRKHFSEKEIFDLTFIASTINAWNRIAISARTPAGSYKRR
jgi:AhpD family alkylhydroperoxidase